MHQLSQHTDKDLIQSFLSGNNQAFEALILRYKDRIYSSIYFLVKDKYLAEDIFQDTFVKVIDTITSGRYNEEGKFVSWVLRIAHNLCVDHFRKVKRQPVIQTSDGRDVFDWLNFSEDNQETRMMKTQSYNRMEELLSRLPQEQREVLVLRHYAELSFKEIAKLTNCSINTALGRMRYGLINMRRMIAEKQMVL